MNETCINGVVIETDLDIRISGGVVEVGQDPDALARYQASLRNSLLGTDFSGSLQAAYPGGFGGLGNIAMRMGPQTQEESFKQWRAAQGLS